MEKFRHCKCQYALEVFRQAIAIRLETIATRAEAIALN